jgi:hypothetical protein
MLDRLQAKLSVDREREEQLVAAIKKLAKDERDDAREIVQLTKVFLLC